MAIVTTDDKHYKAIADKIREHMGFDDSTRLLPHHMPWALDNVREKAFMDGKDEGYAYGETEGYGKGHTAGMQEGKIELLQSSKYMNAQASGECIAVNDVSPVEHDVAVKVSSKNILPYPYYHTTKTENGITFTDNGDGSITCNGTATALTYFYFVFASSDIIEPNTKYTLSGGQYAGVYDLRVTDNKTTANVVYDIGKVTFSYEDTSRFSVNILVRQGAVMENVVFKPMLEKGTTATAYTPYVADVSTASVSRYGKNLLTDDTSKLVIPTNRTNYGYVVPLPAGTYTVCATPKGTYNGGCYIYHIAMDENGNEIGNIRGSGFECPVVNTTIKPITFTVGQDFYYYIYDAGSVTVLESVKREFDRFNIMLEKGSTATPYEPYIEPTVYPVDGATATVKSISPNMTLMTDTQGVLMDCSYLRDIDTYIDNLMMNVAMTGGD